MSTAPPCENHITSEIDSSGRTMISRLLFLTLYVFVPSMHAAIHNVDIGPGMLFNPSTVNAQVGDTVTWTFRESNHTTTSDAVAGPDAWNSGVQAPLATFSHTFVNAGTHPYYCQIHSFPGGTFMNGVIQVEAAPPPPPVPVLMSVNPNVGSTDGGTAVTLSGMNFTNDCTASFGGIAATSNTFVNSTTLNATTPAHVAGTVDVQLTCLNGSPTLPLSFTFGTPAPAVPLVSLPVLWMLAITFAAVGWWRFR